MPRDLDPNDRNDIVPRGRRSLNAQGEEVLNDDEMVQLESDALDDKPKLRFDS